MKNTWNKLILLLFIVLAFPQIGSSQDDLSNEIRYEVNRVVPYISITKKKLNKAHTLTDINKHYKPSWAIKFISVEVFAIIKGETKKALGENDSLTREQKDMMMMADGGTDISVKVQYIPNNTLKHNDIKEINFSFIIEPESDATYLGEQQQLKKYLKENAIDKIPNGSFKNYELTAVEFVINEEGQVTDVHVFESVYQTLKNEKIDELLLAVICNMPNWKPAEYANGTKVKQEFVLTVGNHESCLIPLLNIRQDFND